MEFNDKIERIVQNQKIKKRLQEIGIYSTQVPTGPTGPSGRGLEILGSYDSLEELKKNHEKGEISQSYLVNGILYVWNGEKNSWVSAGNVQGPTGPKGDQGLIGPIGPKGGTRNSGTNRTKRRTRNSRANWTRRWIQSYFTSVCIIRQFHRSKLF